MSRAEIHKMPIQDGDKSVLSGKDTIMGMPKTPAMRRESGDSKHCKSVLEGPECIKGVRGKRKKKGQQTAF
jgi:hypothetical protein